MNCAHCIFYSPMRNDATFWCAHAEHGGWIRWELRDAPVCDGAGFTRRQPELHFSFDNYAEQGL